MPLNVINLGFAIAFVTFWPSLYWLPSDALTYYCVWFWIVFGLVLVTADVWWVWGLAFCEHTWHLWVVFVEDFKVWYITVCLWMWQHYGWPITVTIAGITYELDQYAANIPLEDLDLPADITMIKDGVCDFDAGVDVLDVADDPALE